MAELDSTDLGDGDARRGGFDDTITGARRLADRDARGGRSRLQRGELVGRYVVLSELGEGGMGVVYAAYDPELDRKVALKLLLPTLVGSGTDGPARLLREAQALARLTHPNIVAVHDVGTRDQEVWVAMELVAGRSLDEWLGEQRRPWREILEVLRPAAIGLAAAHSAGLVHRDVKPHNVMLGDDGRVRVMDFGLARGTDATLDDEGAENSRIVPRARRLHEELTRADATPGTPAYMAPEHLRGVPVGVRADQFAYCVMLWEALLGERPFQGESLQELATNILEGRRRPPPKGAAVPSWLLAIVERGLATDPAARWPSIDALLAAIDDGARRQRRRRGVAIGGSVVLAGGVAAALPWLAEQRRIARCEQAGAAFGEPWNDAEREAVREGLHATKTGHAATTAELVMPWLDAHADALRSARTEVCMHAEVDATWNADTSGRAQWCLDERRLELAALVDRLRTADADTVTKAVQATAALRDVQPCLDESRLARLPALPESETGGLQLLRAELSRAAALEATAAYDEGLAVARSTLDAAKEIDWPPIRAAAAVRVGALLSRRGAFAEAEEMLERAFFEAATCGATEDAVEAAARLVDVVGIDLARPKDGERWAKLARVMRAELPDPSRLREAANLEELADVRYAMGVYPEAVALYTEALALEEAALGGEHPDVATILGNLAIAHKATGAYEAAAALLTRALAIREAVLGADHPDVARTLNALGNVRRAQGEYDEAIASHTRALAIKEKALGPDHRDVATSLGNLADVRARLGELDEADALLTRAIAIEDVGPEHAGIAHNLDELATLRRIQGRLDEAAALELRAIAIRERALGPEHPKLATSLSGLASVRRAQGDYRDAEKLFRRALAIRERALGPAHVDVAECLVNLAGVRETQGAIDEARASYERAAEIIEAAFGPDHPDLAAIASNLAILEFGDGRNDEAIAGFERALAIQERELATHPGTQHPEIASTLGNLALVRETVGDTDEAERLHRRALAIRESALGRDHIDTARSISSLGNLMSTVGRNDEAVELLTRALAIREAALGPDHVDVAYSLAGLGRARMATGALEEAAALLRRSLAIREKALGPEHPDGAGPLVGLSRIAMTRGRHDEAVALAERAVALRESSEHNPVELAEARLLLARALVAARGSEVRAQQLATLARDAAQRGGVATRRLLDEAEAFVREHGTPR